MSPMSDWNNTKLVVHQHHNDLYKLTAPHGLSNDPGSFTFVKPNPTLKQTVQLLAVALIVAILHR
ncbi:MAG: hypothetical protein ABI700_08490 [Chloroflexota bacterium]